MDQAEYKKLQRLIEPCLEPEDLDRFLVEQFNIELPWDTVDERSTSAPLKFVWSLYEIMLYGKTSTPGIYQTNRHVVAAARNSAKTLASSLIQFLSMLHFRRDGAHIAATLDQSAQAIMYLDNLMSNPILQPYRKTDNVKKKIFTNLPPNDYTVRSHSQMQVVTATKKGANAPRASCLTYDEVDLTAPEILSEAAYIADPAIRYLPDGSTEKRSAIFIYLSSRKTNHGPIQTLIDESQEKNSKNRPFLHKWSTVDWMEKCPESRHKPDLGKIDAYLHYESLKTTWGKEEFEATVPENKKGEYKHVHTFKGCKECPAWIACQGRSVNQRGLSPSLRDAEFVGDVLSSVRDPSAIIAQTLNWKPETSGIVFRTFTQYLHLKEPIDFYQFVTRGVSYNPYNLPPDELIRIYNEGTAKELAMITPTKDDIYAAMREYGWIIGAGVDWGYYPDPAVCVVVGYHKKWDMGVVLHTESANWYSNSVWAQHVKDSIHPRFPLSFVAPDQADPSSITYFSPTISCLGSKDKPPRIITGVSFLRGLLWDAQKNETRFAILDDSQQEDGNIMVVEAMEHWTHAKDPLGRFIPDKFSDDEYTHPIDAMRYFYHPFTKHRDIKASSEQTSKYDNEHTLKTGYAKNDPEAHKIVEERNKLKTQFAEHMSREFGIHDPFKTKQDDEETKSKSSGSIKFSF